MTFDIEWAPDMVIGKRYRRLLAQLNEPTIRVAAPGDLPGILEMHERCTSRSLDYRYLSGTFRPSPAQHAQLISPQRGCALVGQAGDHIIGVANLVGSAGDACLCEAAILIEDSWQGRGIGTAMMRELLTLTSRHGAMQQVELHVDATNTPALRLIRKLFRELDEEPRYTIDGPLITFTLATTRRTPRGG